MAKATSIFLDVLRSLAALAVFADHCVLVLCYSDLLETVGHEAVVVFFVLSGYVIACATLRRPTTGREYILARLSRLYSVVVPALAVTVLTVLMGKALHLQSYDQFVRDNDPLRFLSTAVFLQSIWGHNLTPLANNPFWSLGYEFWYYAMFGCVVFLENRKWKILSLMACALVVGGNVLLLLPLWLLGAGLYFYGNRIHLSREIAAAGFIATGLVTALCICRLPDYPAEVGEAPLFFSGSFLKDWVVGTGVMAIIGFFDRAWNAIGVAPLVEKIIRWPARHSFSLYLFHFPLLVFFQALGIFDSHVWWSLALEISLVLGLILLMAEYTELKRGRLHDFLAKWI